MSGPKPPAAPQSPVGKEDLQKAWGGALSNIDQISGNQIPQQMWNMFSPGLMSMYGFDPSQAVNFGNMWSSMAPNMFGAGTEALRMAFDPQKELFGTMEQRARDSARLANVTAGLGGTPYGAGAEAQGMRDFYMNWENQQLQRALQGIQGAAGAYGAGGQAILGGQGLASQIPQMMSGYVGDLQNLGMGSMLPQMQSAGLYASLFGAGTNAQNQAYQNALQQWQARQNQRQGFWSGIGKLGGNVFGMVPFL